MPSGRINALGAGKAAVAADFALGAGFGTTASLTVTAGSNAQRGQVVVTSAGTGQAQATATVTFTFPEAFGDVPVAAIVAEVANTQTAVGEGPPIDVTTSTTTLVWKAKVLPVATKVYTYNYFVV